MRIVQAQYKGHINNNFIFAVNKQNIIFMPHEITVISMPLVDLIKIMHKEINSWYKLAVFWDPYGYYVVKTKTGKYDLYDALTNINTGTTYETLESIPEKYMYKYVQKYQRKILLAKFRPCST
jgi:hypothetical protein